MQAIGVGGGGGGGVVYWDNGEENGNRDYRGCIGGYIARMEKKVETGIGVIEMLYRILEKKMITAISY